MKYLLGLLTVILLFVAGCTDDQNNPNVPPDSGERIYVVQTSDESLAEINLRTGLVNSHVLDLGLYPNDIVKHGTKLYVANSGDNTVQEIDAESNQTLRVLPVGNGASPWSMAFLNDDTMAVTCYGTRKVNIVRMSDGASIGEWTTATAPEGVVVDGGRVYVCETGVAYPDFAPGQVKVFDASTWQMLDSMVVGVNAQFAAVDSVHRLHVVCTGNYGDVAGSIYVIDLAAWSTIEYLQVGGAPNTVSFGNGYAFVSAGGFGGAPGIVFRYRLDDLTVMNDATNPLESGAGVIDIEALPDGSFLSSCFEADEVLLQQADGVVTHTFLVSDGPAYLVAYP